MRRAGMTFILMVALGSFAQDRGFEMTRQRTGPTYYYDIVTHAAGDSGHVLLRYFMKVAYGELRFVRMEEGGYRAGYELTVVARDAQGNQADGKIVNRDVVVPSFSETQGMDRFDLCEVDLRLLPGKYTLIMRLVDRDSKETGSHQIDLTLRDYRKASVMMSDLLLVDTVVTGSSGEVIPIPNVFWNFPMGQERLYLLFDVYSQDSLASYPLTLRLIRDKQVVRRMDEQVRTKGHTTPVVFSFDRGDLMPARYRLEVQVGEGERSDRRIKELIVRWADVPLYALDLDRAIEQLRYIAKSKEIKQIRKAKGEEEKKRLFMEFWKALDPTPGTAVNELMDEYYARIDFANRHFKERSDGWKTDRGMVYILLGPPNDIERYPFEMGTKPYEIWIYYQLGRRFVFVDETGFGDYRLVTPFSEVIRGF